MQCEKLRTEAAALPGLRAELEALKQRHFQALELMGERDEEVWQAYHDLLSIVTLCVPSLLFVLMSLSQDTEISRVENLSSYLVSGHISPLRS